MPEPVILISRYEFLHQLSLARADHAPSSSRAAASSFDFYASRCVMVSAIAALAPARAIIAQSFS